MSELERYHAYTCTKCGAVQEHSCDRPAVQPQNIHLLQYSETLREPHSVEISRNAKGEYSFTVKAYGETIEEAFVRCKDGVGLALGRIRDEK